MPRIFEKGFTSTTQHEDSRATGMGLYLAQKLRTLFLFTLACSQLLTKARRLHLPFLNQMILLI